MIKKDPIVEMVKQDWDDRSRKGIKDYGTTLLDNKHDDFLQHLYEELLDSILYIKKLQYDKEVENNRRKASSQSIH